MKQKLNIFWLASVPLIGDTDSHPVPWVFALGKEIIKYDIDLRIVSVSSQIENEVHNIEVSGIKITYIKVPKKKLDFLTLYYYRVRKVRNYLKKNRNLIDLIHIHGTEHQFGAMTIGLDVPVVTSIQGILGEYIKLFTIKQYKTWILWKLGALYERSFLKKQNHFMCRTHWDTNYIKSVNPEASIYNIWEVIRPEFFERTFRFGNSSILFVGGANPLKGLKSLLIAYNNEIQDLDVKIIIAGNCTINDVKNLIKSEKLDKIKIENIETKGVLNASEMVETYRKCFCLVHPTLIDNSPNSVCEAQVSGLPVIATDVGGVSSLIDNGVTGILIKDPISELKQAVESILTSEELSTRMSKKSMEVARERHNAQEIVNQTLDRYRELIQDEVSNK